MTDFYCKDGGYLSYSVWWRAGKRPKPGTERGEIVANKPWVDKEECISCGICVSNCPEVFRLDAHGKSECYNPSGAPAEVIQSMAIDVCPVSCILWEE